MEDVTRIFVNIAILISLSFMTRLFDEGFLRNKLFITIPLVVVYLGIYLICLWIGALNPTVMSSREGSTSWLYTYIFAVLVE